MGVELSVAIIFKNEIRCLERCLKSLMPLKEQLSCEIVMADTGATDGSRAIAERYADVIFDFAWVNDFSAARNAVFERCSGQWALVLDCDEWLDQDIGELVRAVKGGIPQRCTEAAVQRFDYTTPELEKCVAIYIARLFRMSAKPRYTGKIHETVVYGPEGALGRTWELMETVLHHDGYVMLNDGSEEGKAKRARNVEMLRQALEEEPENLRRWMQWLESGGQEEDYYAMACRGVALVKEKKARWEDFGPGILRAAISGAADKNFGELEEWYALAEELFPNSCLTRIDIEYAMMLAAWKRNEWKKMTERGESYLRACRSFRNDKTRIRQLWFSSLNCGDSTTERETCLLLADVYRKQKDHKKADAKLREIAFREMNAEQVTKALKVIWPLYRDSELETATLMNSFWDGIGEETPNAERARGRKRAFFETGCAIFDSKAAEAKKGKEGWRLFLPLAGKCPLGDAAELLKCETADAADAVLERVEDPAALPGTALVHAMKLGAAFPVPDKPLTVEQADVLAARLAIDRPFLREAARFAASAAEDDADVIWARALALAAIQGVEWETDAEAKPLLRAFVRAESAFLARCYNERALKTPEYLPPMHRFALHLSNAFAALDPAALSPEFSPTVSGGVRAALPELKAAVLAAPELKGAVDWILDDILRNNQ